LLKNLADRASDDQRNARKFEGRIGRFEGGIKRGAIQFRGVPQRSGVYGNRLRMNSEAIKIEHGRLRMHLNDQNANHRNSTIKEISSRI
jgi:hypothetical protein